MRTKRKALKQQSQVDYYQETDDSDDDLEQTYGGYSQSVVKTDQINQVASEILSEVTFPNGKTMAGKVDSGAQVTNMPLNNLHELGFSKKDLKPTKKRLRSATGDDMKAVGELDITVTANGQTHDTN